MLHSLVVLGATALEQEDEDGADGHVGDGAGDVESASPSLACFGKVSDSQPMQWNEIVNKRQNNRPDERDNGVA